MADESFFTIPECGGEMKWHVTHKDIITRFVTQFKDAFEHRRYRECLDLITKVWSTRKADSDDSMIEEAYSQAGMAMIEFLCHQKSTSSPGTNQSELVGWLVPSVTITLDLDARVYQKFISLAETLDFDARVFLAGVIEDTIVRKLDDVKEEFF